MPESPNQSDLLLLAYRYQSGDLPPAEMLAFENQLAESQSARDCLADVVLLAESLRSSDLAVGESSVERLKGPPHRPMSLRRRTWLALAGVSLVTVCCLLLLIPVGNFNSLQRVDLSRAGSRTVAKHAAGSNASVTATLWASLSDPAEEVDEWDESTGAVPLEVPDWMLLAVSSHATENNSDETPLVDDKENL